MRIIIIIAIFLLIPALSFAQTTWYVDDDAPDDPGPHDPNISDPLEDGSEDHPFDTIQEAIDAAAIGFNETILVKDGLYIENHSCPKSNFSGAS